MRCKCERKPDMGYEGEPVRTVDGWGTGLGLLSGTVLIVLGATCGLPVLIVLGALAFSLTLIEL